MSVIAINLFAHLRHFAILDNIDMASALREVSETMDIQEVSDTLKVSRATIMRRVKDGTLTPLPKPPLLKRHYKLQFPRAQVEALARSLVQ